jgi:hypothetical protein
MDRISERMTDKVGARSRYEERKRIGQRERYSVVDPDTDTDPALLSESGSRVLIAKN